MAAKHYLQVTDEHFERVAKGGEPAANQAVQDAVQNPVHALQNPVQQAAAVACTESHSGN